MLFCPDLLQFLLLMHIYSSPVPLAFQASQSSMNGARSGNRACCLQPGTCSHMVCILTCVLNSHPGTFALSWHGFFLDLFTARSSHGSLQLQHSMFGPGHAQISRYRGPNPYKLASAWQESAEYYWFNAGGLLGGFVKNEAGDRPM